MGHVWVEAKILNLDRTKSKKVSGLVDTGATLSTLPAKLAKELGIGITSEDKIQTASGIITIQKGRAIIRIEKKEELQPIWISDIIDRVLIGSVTLETLGLKVNPITVKVEETPLMLYSHF